MSHQAVTWAYEQDVTPSGAKFVLVTLANYANGDGYCYPGQASLATDTGMNERHVRRCLTRLKELGLIYREHRYGTTGKRVADGCWLIGFKPLPDDRAVRLPDNIADSLTDNRAGSDEVTTGHFVPDYRTIEPVVPLNVPPPQSPPPLNSPCEGVDSRTVSELSEIAPQEPARPTTDHRALVFETMYELWIGKPYEPPGECTDDERGRLNRAVGQLARKSEATPGEIKARWREAAARASPGYPVTPQTLTKSWTDLANERSEHLPTGQATNSNRSDPRAGPGRYADPAAEQPVTPGVRHREPRP